MKLPTLILIFFLPFLTFSQDDICGTSIANIQSHSSSDINCNKFYPSNQPFLTDTKQLIKN